MYTSVAALESYPQERGKMENEGVERHTVEPADSACTRGLVANVFRLGKSCPQKGKLTMRASGCAMMGEMRLEAGVPDFQSLGLKCCFLIDRGAHASEKPCSSPSSLQSSGFPFLPLLGSLVTIKELALFPATLSFTTVPVTFVSPCILFESKSSRVSSLSSIFPLLGWLPMG